MSDFGNRFHEIGALYALSCIRMNYLSRVEVYGCASVAFIRSCKIGLVLFIRLCRSMLRISCSVRRSPHVLVQVVEEIVD